MKNPETLVERLSRGALAAAMILTLAPASLVAGESSATGDGWEPAGAGMLVRASESTVEYFAHGREGNANLLPIVQEERARAEQSVANDPSKENYQLLEALLQAEDQIAAMAAEGPPSDPRIETEGPTAISCTTFGAGAFTGALSCGNRSDAYAWAATFSGCTGPFNIGAFAAVSRTCYKTTDTATDLDWSSVAGSSFGFATASAVLTGAYSSCGFLSVAWAISPNDNISLVVFDNGIGTGCGTDPFTCALCARPNDDPN